MAILTLQIPFGLQALRTGTCWTQESCAVQSQGRTDALAAPALGHISTIPLCASRRVRSPEGSQYPTTLCSGSESPGTGRRPSGSVRWSRAWSPLTLLPGLPLPSSLARSSSEERKGAGRALPRGCPGERGGPRPRPRPTPPAPPPGPVPALRSSPAAPRPAPLCWRPSRNIPLGKEGFPEFSRPLGSYPCPCPVELIFRPVREYLVRGKTAPGKQGEPSALSLAWFSMLSYTAFGKRQTLTSPGESGKTT